MSNPGTSKPGMSKPGTSDAHGHGPQHPHGVHHHAAHQTRPAHEPHLSSGHAGPDGLDPDDERWVAYVRADHRTGTIAALAGVFATRGVNFESLATGDVHGDVGLVVVTFFAGARRQRILTRAVTRLPMVRGVLVRAATDPKVRAAAVLNLPPGSSFRPDPGASVRWFGDPEQGEPMLVEGSLTAVEAVVAAARAEGGTSEGLVLRAPAA